MATYRIPIEGMTCTSCVGHITKAVRRVEGVSAVRVDLRTDSATVSFDPELTSLQSIEAAITTAGYEPGTPEPVTRAVTPPARSGFLARLGLGR